MRWTAPIVFGLIALIAPLSAPPLADEAPSSQESLDQQMVDAAQRQDLAEMRRLLEAGASVDAANAYSATPLFVAADRGSVEMAKLLLERGADVNVVDTFYGATALGWALSSAGGSKPHRDVALLILKKAPDAAADSALSIAVTQDDMELLKAAVETEKIGAEAIRKALAIAEGGDKKEMVAYLSPRVPEEEQAKRIELTAEDLEKYLGDFKNADIGMAIKIFADGNQLKAQSAGQPELTLDPTDKDAFEAREAAAVFKFGGRAGLIEGFQFTAGTREFYFLRDQPTDEATAQAEAEPELPAIGAAERLAAAPWPSFRGDNASGIGDGQGVVTTWNGEKGENVRWKTPIPGIALSSPIIWGDRVFLTTAASKNGDTTFRTGNYGDVDSVDDDTVHVFRVYALDRKTGEILWQKDADRGVPQVKRHLKSSHANPTPVTDGERVVAHFGSEGLFCYSMDGELLWKVDLGRLDSGWFFDASYQWGFASSPILHDGRVIVQTDIHKGSFIAAFDVRSGEELWRTARDEIPTWGTPSILPAATSGGVDEVITNGTTVRGYSATTGEELWTLAPNSEITVGTPVIAEGMAFVTGGYPPARPIYAIKPGGR
ncbi:MAG: PQQ-binding-like beta-propeller repeat protein, partial [Acidobacteriota bacterium]